MVAEWAGHSVKALLDVYAGCIDGQEDAAKRRIEAALSTDDLAAAIRELKAKPAGELQVHGSGALTRWLLEHDLVDEMNLLIVPVVVGQGMRLFPATGPDMALDLVESRASATALAWRSGAPMAEVPGDVVLDDEGVGRSGGRCRLRTGGDAVGC